MVKELPLFFSKLHLVENVQCHNNVVVGIKLRTFSVGSDRSTNWATITALNMRHEYGGVLVRKRLTETKFKTHEMKWHVCIQDKVDGNQQWTQGSPPSINILSIFGWTGRLIKCCGTPRGLIEKIPVYTFWLFTETSSFLETVIKIMFNHSLILRNQFITSPYLSTSMISPLGPCSANLLVIGYLTVLHLKITSWLTK